MQFSSLSQALLNYHHCMIETLDSTQNPQPKYQGKLRD